MQAHQRIYLALLRQELDRSIVPACSTDMAKQISMCGSRLLSRVLADEISGPEISREAITAYRSLLPRLREQLGTPDLATFEQELAAAGDLPSLDRALATVCRSLLGPGDLPGRHLASRLVAIDATVQSRREEAYQRQLFEPSKTVGSRNIGGLTLDEQDRVLQLLRDQYADNPDLEFETITPVAGGFSKQTLFLSLKNNVTLPDVIVMRRDSGYSASRTSVSREYPIIKALYHAGVAVPKPFAIEGSGALVGSKFILTARLTGRNIGDPLEVSTPNAEATIDLAHKIAALHRVPVTSIGDTLGDPSLSVCDRVLAEIERLKTSWNRLPFESFVMDAAFEWLRANICDADGSQSIVHRDIGPHNFLVDGDEVTGFLDWEVCAIGNPLEDLGYAHYTVSQMGDWQTFLSTYEQAAGFKVDERQLNFYVLWGQVRLLVLISEAKAAIWHDLLPDLQFAYVGEHYSQRISQRIAGKLKTLLAPNVE